MSGTNLRIILIEGEAKERRSKATTGGSVVKQATTGGSVVKRTFAVSKYNVRFDEVRSRL